MSLLDRILGGRPMRSRVKVEVLERERVIRVTGNGAGLERLESIVNEARRRGVAAAGFEETGGEIVVRREDDD